MSARAPSVRLVIADEREASFFDLASSRADLRARGALTSDAAGLKDRDLESDRPGRGAHRVTPSRHAIDGERSAERHEAEQFARQVARAIDAARVRHEFDRLVIMAAPRMLGLLREALPDSCRPVVAAEIPKDFGRQDEKTIREAVPREVFFN